MNSIGAVQTFLGMPAVVESRAMRALMELVQKVALSKASVLITGESGVGKEVVARAIHEYSQRSRKPWVDVSCGALPENLVESELFGHEKGAFSGADNSKPGLFELADKGTFFLDEVGELPPQMQVKLLRVLDGVPYYRLGGRRKIEVDVRVVAATNVDLEEAVRSHSFRSDLYYRLNQIRIEVPPLRQRPEDIIPLANFFVQQERPDCILSQAAKDKLWSYEWPGNVRELRNVMQRIAILAESTVIRAEDLEIDTAQMISRDDAIPLCRLSEMEDRMIGHALRVTEGNRGRAADILGISLRTLSRKLKQLNPVDLTETGAGHTDATTHYHRAIG